MKTTPNYWSLAEGELFRGIEILGHRDCMLIDMNQDTDDGTFPRVSDYVRYVNKLEAEGTAYFLNRCSLRKKLKFQYDTFTVTRESEHTAEAVIEFKEPITVVFGKVGDTEITSKIKRLRGEFIHDWFWTKSGRQEKVANGFEVWFAIKEYLE
jgi:hypothetical protein